MKFNTPHTLEQIAQLIDCKYVGDPTFPVLGMNEIHVVTPGDIVFVDHPKYYDKALESAATVVLINKEVECPEGKALLISDDPFRDFNKLTQHFNPFRPATAVISDTAKIGKNTIIQPKIGRASCRERVSITVCAGTIKQKYKRRTVRRENVHKGTL